MSKMSSGDFPYRYPVLLLTLLNSMSVSKFRRSESVSICTVLKRQSCTHSLRLWKKIIRRIIAFSGGSTVFTKRDLCRLDWWLVHLSTINRLV